MFHTDAAPGTRSGIKRHPGRRRRFYRKNMKRTGFHAPKTADAPGRVKEKFRFGNPRFRIMTPTASQGAAFKENDGSDTLTVIHTAPLNIKH
jgi:hypothetical protein